MLYTLTNTLQAALTDLAYTGAASAQLTLFGECLPTISQTFFTKMIAWLAQIISGIAILVMAWSAIQQIQMRDWGKLGGEVIGTMVLLLLIVKADTIITTLMNWMDITKPVCT